MQKEKLSYWLIFIMCLFFVGVGLHEFDVEHNYLTGLFLTIGGIIGGIENEYKNRQNNESL